MIAPAVASRRALDEIQREARPFLGHVSEDCGFVPPAGLPDALPASHRAWDELAMSLPALWQDMTVRDAVLELPELAAGPEDLPDRALWRASVVLAALGHSFLHCDLEDLHARAPPLPLPGQLARPWAQVSARMGRRAPHVAYDDLMTCNWRLLDARRSDPMRVENLVLAVPLLGNAAEHGFLCTNIEITAQLAPVVGAVIRAQEAVARDDRDGLARELLAILERVCHVTEVSLPKLDPNAYGRGFTDPVVWAKLTAILASPIAAGVPGVSGADATALRLVDQFLGRTRFETPLGADAVRVRAWYAPNVRRFLDGVDELAVRDYARRGDPELVGLFQSLVDAWTGERGYLATHRRKVYGYVQTGYKVGRSPTASGLAGSFSQRPWRIVAGQLDAAREERHEELFACPQRARLMQRVPAGPDPDGTRRIVLDVANTGTVHRPGDRCSVMPLNAPDLIARTLEALGARGDEAVPLAGPWRAWLRMQAGGPAPEHAPVRDVLAQARLRPLSRAVGKVLAELSGSAELIAVLEARSEDQHEVWEAIEMASEAGYDPRRMWRAALWRDECLTRILAPIERRMYSISDRPDKQPLPGTIELTVGPLLLGPRSPRDGERSRRGTASTYLTRDATIGSFVDLKVVRPVRFRLPEASRPVVMFAGGTGIAPFRGFIAERMAAPGAAPTWLFAAARTRAELPYREELERLAADGRLELRTAISRETVNGSASRRIGAAVAENAEALSDMLGDAVFYVCGRAAFADSVVAALASAAGGGEAGRATIRRLVGERRLMSDLFTTFAPAAAAGLHGADVYDVTELVEHNDDEHGRWIAISGLVYDVSEFRHLHAGGSPIIDDNAGLDATAEYRAVAHHEDSEIEAMLAMFKIGFMRRYDFGSHWGVAVHGGGMRYVSLHDLFRVWVRQLYLTVEMQNALRNDVAFMGSPLARGDDGQTLTPLKLMLGAELHGRFLGSYLPEVAGDALQELWALSCGLLDPDAEATAMARRLRAAAHSPAGRAAKAGNERFRALVARREVDPRGCGELLEQLQAADATLLAGVKRRLRTGLRAFEVHEARVLQRGPEVLDCLRSIGTEVESFHRCLADVWERGGV